MTDEDTKDKNFFEKYGLELSTTSEIEIGQTYPIYGMITNFLESEDDGIWVELNFNIKLLMCGISEEKLNILRERAFDTGIFFTEIKEIGAKPYHFVGECRTAVYGKKQNTEVN
jgi:hypothetical protein